MGRTCKLKAKALLLGEVDEFPLIREGALVEFAKTVKDDAPGRARTGWHFQQLDELLGVGSAGHEIRQVERQLR
jgi:hypothetical protein